MYWWQLLLSPFALLFHGITWVRNALYDRKIKRSVRFDANVIGIGNLSIGGTGKTPMVQLLISYFHQKNWKAATLSRGYGRRTKGFRLATIRDTPDTIGDEPFLYWQSYHGKVPVAVGEERDLALSELFMHHQDTHVVLLDDSFQNRRIVPSVNIMLTTYERPFYEDWPLPMGRLREARKGAMRADIILVTKCPAHLSDSDQLTIKHHIAMYSSAEVFFTTTKYGNPEPFFDNAEPFKNRILAIAGIANPMPFFQFVQKNYSLKLKHSYPDHHRYSNRDIKDILMEMDGNTSLLTTAKDMVKLQQFSSLQSSSCFYLPVYTQFIRDESLFFSKLESFLKNYEIASN